MGSGGTPAREISFVSLVAYGPNSDSALTMGVTASETRQGGSQQDKTIIPKYVLSMKDTPQNKRYIETKSKEMGKNVFC